MPIFVETRDIHYSLIFYPNFDMRKMYRLKLSSKDYLSQEFNQMIVF